MNPTYTLPAVLSLTIHGVALAYGITWIDMPTINLEEAPSALEICVVGTEEQVSKEKGKRKKEKAVQPVEEIVREEETNAVKEEQKASRERAEEIQSETEKDTESTSVENNSILGNSAQLHNSYVGVQYDAIDAEPIINPAPRYPRRARERGEEGMVILDVEILSDGDVGTVSIYKSSGYSLLDQSALNAVKKWHFSPAQSNGNSLTVHRKIPIIFKLK